LVEPGRPDQLAAALQKLADDSELCHSMQQKSYQFASEKHDMEQRVIQVVDVYRATASNGRVRREDT
jgi:glycosyltransferase involved in cell wall biosynthesis